MICFFEQMPYEKSAEKPIDMFPRTDGLSNCPQTSIPLTRPKWSVLRIPGIKGWCTEYPVKRRTLEAIPKSFRLGRLQD